MGRLSTHVLDIATGHPAGGVAVELRRLTPDGDAELLVRAVTNADGRTDAPLLQGGRMRAGAYELTFAVGDYFRSRAVAGLADPPFLDWVPVVFQVADAVKH